MSGRFCFFARGAPASTGFAQTSPSPGLVDGWILGDEFQSCQPTRPTIYASPRRADLAHSGSDRVYIRHPVSPIDLLLTLERLSDEVEANRVTARSPEPRAAA